jgi:hypothetical protein
MAPTANSICESVRTLADYIDQRSKQADVSPDVTLDKVYRDLDAIAGLLVEMDEDSRVLPTLYGARIIGNINPTPAYAVEVYDLASNATVAISGGIAHTLGSHVEQALTRMNHEGNRFCIAAQPMRIGSGRLGVRWVVRAERVTD